MSININTWRHPLQGGRSQIPSWAKPNSNWNQIALEGRDQAYYQTTISVLDINGKTTEMKVEGIIGLGPKGQPVLFSKRAVEHLLEDERVVKNVSWETTKEKSRTGIEYTVGQFKEVGK